ncbi:hypothetical protein CFter6_0049 [Collimonas fungivorans]|uniref:DUF2782 domain-containing protein n=1 Tax=Collimonas fungivorans TaxID=158899 RepID=A0A127P4K8_9BURK|nr:hypothetical protein [Collimonas fungivorans]AMO92780.1 hypothetical protein CFter6_0049 [Collimonas fungivorans]
MNMHTRYTCSGLLGLSLAFAAASASAADQPAAPASTSKAGTAAQNQVKRPGDGVELTETAPSPLVAVKGADGRVVVQHSNDTVAPQKKNEVR